MHQTPTMNALNLASKRFLMANQARIRRNQVTFFLSPVSVPLHLQLWQAFLDELNHLQSHFLSS
jgi:hypothetical protein